jgi:hypothetical protein
MKVSRSSGASINLPVCQGSIEPWRAKQSMATCILRSFLRFLGGVFELDNEGLDAGKMSLLARGDFSMTESGTRVKTPGQTRKDICSLK